MPGLLGGGQNAQPKQPFFGPQLKDAIIKATPLLSAMAAGYSSGRGPYAYLDQGIAGMQAAQKAKRDEEAAAAAAAAFAGLVPGGMGRAGGGGAGGSGAYKPPTDMPAANLGGVSGMGNAGIALPGAAPADMGMVGNGGLSFGGSKLPPDQAAIRAGLIARGYPEHVADGIMMNLADESGFNPAAVGDNGNALGLAQWNGPRKAALESFAAQQGKSPTDINVQLDFLDHELKGSHASAGSAVMSAKTAPEAAVAFLNQFEMPAEQYRTAREATYLGGAGGAPAATPATTDPMADPYVQQLMTVMAMPGLTPEQRSVVELQLQSRMTLLAPQAGTELPAGYRELDLQAQAGGLVPGSPEYQQFMLSGGAGIAGGEGPAAFQALHMQALAAGFPEGSPEYKQFMATRGAGLAAESKAIGEAKGSATAAAPAEVAAADETLGFIDEVRNHPGIDMGTGMSSVLNAVPGTSGYDFQNRVNQLLSGGFLTAIDQLRGMGSLSNAEGQTATRAISRMDTATSKEEFLAALDDYERVVKTGRERAANRMAAPTDAAPAAGGNTTATGVTWSVAP